MKLFHFLEFIFSKLFFFIYILILAISLFPGVIIFYSIFSSIEGLQMPLRIILICIFLSGIYMSHQILFPILCGVLFRISPLRFPEGEFPLHSWNGVKWAFCTALHRSARQHFPMYTLPSWYVNFYYRLMGAKISKGAHIASLNINDPQHVIIGSGSVIGGGTILNSHSAESGNLIVAKIVIGTDVTVGLKSILLPGVRIEDNAIVGARSVVTKYVTVPAKEKWVGVPASKLVKKKQ